MAVVVVQMGHVGRATGKTGTWREQELARAIGERLREQLRAAGHLVHLMGADDAVPVSKGDVFVSLHGDSGNAQVAGRGRSTVRGASVGFPDADGARIGAAWKRAHLARGWPGGMRADNNTSGMSNYYMWGKQKAGKTAGFRFRYLAEHATLTNSTDEDWIFAHLDDVAAAHVAAISEVVGGVVPSTIDVPETSRGSSERTHTVVAGDTLHAIARRFGVSVDALQRHNAITDPARLPIGLVLRIPGPSGESAAAKRTHTVAAGDTLFSIARRFGVSAEALQVRNSISDPTKLPVGTVLSIP